MSNESNVIYPFADPDIKYTMMDNYLFDHIMPVVKPNAWKILCLIIRKTRGWHKATDQISFSQIKAGTGISSDETVSNALKQLVGKGYILATKGGQWDATEYAINTKYSTTKIEVGDSATSKNVVEPTTEIEVGSTTKIEDTKETSFKEKKDKKLSADADCSRPISLLSLEKIKAKDTKMTIAEWKQALVDEQAERGRKGVIKFIEDKIKYYNLLPHSGAEKLLFEILKLEYADDGGKTPPEKFPGRETKRLFNEAAEFHNGTLEQVIKKAIHKRGKGIARIVDYISSPKWQENTDEQTRARAGQRKTSSNQSGAATSQVFAPPPGSGQTPEMAAKLRAAFAPKPG